MRPVLRRGRSVLERELLTRDEIDQRLAAFRALLEASGVEAAVVVGTVEAFAPLTYLTAYAPMHQWATALVHRTEPTVLLAGLGGARNLPYVSTLTWVSDLRYYPSVGEGAAAVLAEWGVTGGVGIAGAPELPVGPWRALRRDLEGLRTVDLDGAFARLRRSKRPRELAALRLAAALRDRALAAGRKAAGQAGATPSTVGFAVERAARLGGARDVRVLVHHPVTATWETPGATGHGPSGAPAPGPSGRACTVFLGVERCGYWAEAMAQLHPAPDQAPDQAPAPAPDQAQAPAQPADLADPAGAAAEAVVAAMVGAARPGVPLSAVAQAGLAALEAAPGLDEAARQVAGALGLGAAVGLGRERPVAVPDPAAWGASAGVGRSGDPGEPLVAGEVLALRCGIPGGAAGAAAGGAAGSGGVAAASRDVVVVEGGTRPLQEVSGA